MKRCDTGHEATESELMREARALIERSKAGDALATSLLWAMIDGPIENEETDVVNEYLAQRGISHNQSVSEGT